MLENDPAELQSAPATYAYLPAWKDCLFIKVMTPAHILLIGWGTGIGAEMAVKGILTSMAGGGYETAELTVSCPASDQEAERISEVVAGRNPDLLLLFLSSDAVVQTGSIFFEFACRNRWRVPTVVVCPTAEPHDVLEPLRLGALEVLTLPLGLKEVIARLLTLHGRARKGGLSCHSVAGHAWSGAGRR